VEDENKIIISGEDKAKLQSLVEGLENG